MLEQGKGKTSPVLAAWAEINIRGWDDSMGMWGVRSAEPLSNFYPNQIKKKDKIEQALNQGGRKVQVREDPKVVTAEKKDCRQRHRPGPAEEHEQSAARREEEDGKNQEEFRVVPAHGSNNDDHGEQ